MKMKPGIGKFAVSLLLILGLLPSRSYAAWQGEATVSGLYDSNVMRSSYAAMGDRVTEMTASVGYQQDWAGLSGLVSYQFGSVSYDTLSDHNYSIHTFAMIAQHDFARRGWLRTGLHARIRSDDPVYALLDYHEYDGFVDARILLGGQITAFSGYSLRHRGYTTAPELDNLEHQLYGRVSVPFDGGLTVQLQSEYGIKEYAAVLAGTTGSTPSVAQWLNTLKVSRPVFSSTGVMGYVRSRTNSGDADVFITGLSPDSFSEDDLFDDRYSYESREFGVMVSHRLPMAVMLRTGYDYAVKEYRQQALALDGTALPSGEARSDTVSSLWIRAEKPLNVSDGAVRLNLYGEYRWLRNMSNDAYYDYDSRSVSVGLGLLF